MCTVVLILLLHVRRSEGGVVHGASKRGPRAGCSVPAWRCVGSHVGPHVRCVGSRIHMSHVGPHHACRTCVGPHSCSAISLICCIENRVRRRLVPHMHVRFHLPYIQCTYSQYVCMYIYIYTHTIYMYMYMCVRVCMYICTHARYTHTNKRYQQGEWSWASRCDAARL